MGAGLTSQGGFLVGKLEKQQKKAEKRQKRKEEKKAQPPSPAVAVLPKPKPPVKSKIKQIYVQTWNDLPGVMRRTNNGHREAKINGEWQEVELLQP